MTVKGGKCNGMHTFVEIASAVSALMKANGNELPASNDVRDLAYAGAGTAWGGVNRPSWFRSVRKGLHNRDAAWTTTADGDYLCACENCGTRSTAHGLAIDHRQPWLGSITAYQPDAPAQLTRLEARILYNNPHNVRLLCNICNGKHPEAQPPAANTRNAAKAYVNEKIEALIGVRDLD